MTSRCCTTILFVESERFPRRITHTHTTTYVINIKLDQVICLYGDPEGACFGYLLWIDDFLYHLRKLGCSCTNTKTGFPWLQSGAMDLLRELGIQICLRDRSRSRSEFWKEKGMAQNHRTPSHPNPTAKIGNLRWVVNSHNPNQNGIPKRF